jgi:hypothetical protein
MTNNKEAPNITRSLKLPNATYITYFKYTNLSFDTSDTDFVCSSTQLQYLEDYYYFLPFLNSLVYLILFLLVTPLTIFKFQPLKSRGPIPAIAALISFILSLPKSLFQMFLTSEQNSDSVCIITGFFVAPLVIFFVSLIPLSALRYFALLSLSDTKNAFYKKITSGNEEEQKKARKFYVVVMVIFKIISNPFYLILNGNNHN